MKKTKLTAILMACVMMVSMLGACGGEEEKKEAKPSEKTEQPVEEKKEETEGITQEEFTALQEDFAGLVEVYNAVKELYEMEEVAGDQAIEDAMNQTADIINAMGEVEGSTMTREDLDDANETIGILLDTLSAVVDQVEASAETEEAPAESEGITQEEFTALQENFAGLVEAYNAVKELYEMEEVAGDQAIEDAMNQTADIINAMGEVEGSTMTREDLNDANETISILLDTLNAVIDRVAAQ